MTKIQEMDVQFAVKCRFPAAISAFSTTTSSHRFGGHVGFLTTRHGAGGGGDDIALMQRHSITIHWPGMKAHDSTLLLSTTDQKDNDKNIV